MITCIYSLRNQILAMENMEESYEMVSKATAFPEEMTSNVSAMSYYEDQEWEMPMEERIADMIWKYVPSILLFVGTIGNLLSLILFSRKPISNAVCSIYLRFLSLGDLISLIILNVSSFIEQVAGIKIVTLNDFTCQLMSFLVETSICFSAWVLTLMTLERCIAVNVPHKAQMIFTRKRVYLSILGLFLFMCSWTWTNFVVLKTITWYDPLVFILRLY